MTHIREELEQERDWLVALRRDFHEHPELSMAESRTAGRIEEELDALGIPHARVGGTGVLGVIRGAGCGEKTVALRADMDALPIQETGGAAYCSRTDGVMHACGHDAHVACLLGAAKVLARHREDFGGEVRLIFQPGEEIGRGAKEFIDAGALEGADRVFGLHAASDLASGTVGVKPGLNNAAVDLFAITVHGKSAHVSTPQMGVDALYIASQIVVALQGLVTRRTAAVEPVIIGVGKFHAGTTYNALAESAVLEGTTRTVSQETRMRVREMIERTVRDIAGIYGGTGETEWTDITPPLINDPAVCAEVIPAAGEIFGAEQVITDRPLSLSGDNFAEFQLRTPGAYAYLGTADPAQPNTLSPGHNGKFDVDENALVPGAALYAAYALSVLAGE